MPQDKQGTAVAVADNEHQHRFEIAYPDTGDLAGSARYLDHDGERIFFHTEVAEEFGGRGLASILIAQALSATTDAGMDIVAVCPFVQGHLEKKGHQGNHRPGRAADIQLVREQIGDL